MISVCMATHNGEKYIKKQLDSILAQLSDNDELIISDDGSIDKTIEIINSCQDNRIKLLHYKQSEELKKIKKCKGFYLATKNFENALSHAKGDFIFLADQDDIWAENKVTLMSDELHKADIVMSNFSLIDVDDNITNIKFYNNSPIGDSLIINIIKSKYIGCCMAFRKELLENILPFPHKLIAHDYWIGCIGCYYGKFSFINKPLHLYRRSGENVSSSSEKSENSFLFKIRFRLVFMLKLIKRIWSTNRRK